MSDHWVPLGSDSSVLIIQSMATEKIRGDRRHRHTPVCTLKDGESGIVDDSAFWCFCRVLE